MHHGKVRRSGQSCQVGGASRVYSDAEAFLVTIATQVGRIDQGGARSIQLGHEGVRETAESQLHGLHSGKVERLGGPCHVGVASSVHSDAPPPVSVAATQVGRVAEYRASGI